MGGQGRDVATSSTASQASSTANAQQRRTGSADRLAGAAAIRKIDQHAHAPTAEEPVRVLVTGYGAFESIDDNPTAEIAELLGKLKFEGAVVKTKVLPVTWKDVDSFVDHELEGFRADIVIAMGFSRGHHEIKEFAVNHRSGADAAGVEGGSVPIATHGADVLKTTLPVDRIEADQKKLGAGGLEAVDHSEPGDDYLCNYIEYRELSKLAGTGVEVGFLHLSDVQRDLPAVEALVREAIRDVRERRVSQSGKAVASAKERTDHDAAHVALRRIASEG